ncbi:MAG: hypothetical protein C0467_30135 [Planctomycetaceae bacterium]|nr:hypothetical protein [Planctomycetaceae bacterium]
MSDTPDPGTMSAGELIDQLCDDFEKGWLGGNPTPLADVVQAAPESMRSDLFRELLAVEREYRARDERPVSAAEALAVYGAFGPWTGPIIEEVLGATRPWDYARDSKPAGPLSGALAPRPADLPETVGGYRVVRRLGQGGMGVVYLVDDPLGNRQVAVKVMRAHHAADTSARARFIREARSAMAVEDDHVVAVYQVGVDGDTPFLVMPLLKGESLEDRLARDPLPPLDLILKVGREVALGLAAAHDRGLVHRDVKPANTWLEGEPASDDPAARVRRVKVLDFGLARSVDGADGLSMSGAVVGTPAYMAPEQAAGRPVDGRADLFSLGAVLYRMATGQPAFAGPSMTAVLTAIATYDPPPPAQVNPAVPADLSALITLLLHKNPDERPATAREVADALTAIGERRPVSGAARRSVAVWAKWVAVAAAVLALVGGAAVAGRALSVRWFAPAPAPTAPADFVVLVRRPGFDPKPLSEVVPLRNGDSLQVRFRVPPAVHAGLVYVNGSGRLALLQSYPPQEVAHEAIWPGPGQARELTPPAGTEFLFACGRTDRPPTLAELQAAWDTDTAWPSMEPAGRFIRVQPEGVTVEGANPRDFGATVEFPGSDQVKRRLESLREKLSGFALLEGVAFRHQ